MDLAASHVALYMLATAAARREDEDHMLDMLEMLRRHKYEALILDTPAVMHYTSTAPGCDLFPGGLCGIISQLHVEQ